MRISIIVSVWLLISAIQPISAANFRLTWDSVSGTDIGYKVYQSTGTNNFSRFAITTNVSVVASNVDTTVMTRWYVTSTLMSSQTVESQPSNILTNFAVIQPPPSSLTFEAESGALSAPFASVGTYIEQTVQSGVTDGGRASYPFTVTNAGNYTVNILINAPSDANNSIFLNIDAEPTDPQCIWDIPITTGFQMLTASWRGAGTVDANQFVPKVWTLASGSHTLIIRGREAGVQLDRITIAPVTATNAPPPVPQNLRANAITAYRIDVDFDTLPLPATVLIERSQDSRTFTQIASLPPGADSFYINTGLRRNTGYYYRARSRNAAGTSEYSTPLAWDKTYRR